MKLEELLESLFKTNSEFDKGTDAVQAYSKTLSAMTSKVEGMSRVLISLGQETKVFDDIYQSAMNANNTIAGMSKALKGLEAIASNPIIGSNLISGVALESMKSMMKVVEDTTAATDSLDDSTRGLRRYTAEVAVLGRSFGVTFEDSKILRDGISDLSASMDNAEDYFSFGSMKEAATTMMGMGIEADKLDDSVTTLSGSFNLVHASMLMSDATGKSLREVFGDVKSSIYDLGMSADDSVTQIGTFYDIASKTGLTMSSVSSALSSASNGFRLFGMSTDFAKPFLEGFVETLEKVGLGISNASGLATTMSSSVMKMAEDYGKAFFVFQQGGLDFGAGSGVLGGSIGLRAKMLESEKVGSGQADIGMQVAEAMRDTLRNFGGGEIITLQEAADSPDKQQQFAIQQDLLKQFGISDVAKADRTLELLKNLDNINVLGKEETKARLEELVDSTRDQKENTLDESQKTNAHLSKMVAQNTVASATYNGMLETLKSISIATGGMTRGQIMDMSSAMDTARESVDLDASLGMADTLRDMSIDVSKMGNKSPGSGATNRASQLVDVKIAMNEESSSIWKSILEVVAAFETPDNPPG